MFNVKLIQKYKKREVSNFYSKNIISYTKSSEVSTFCM